MPRLRLSPAGVDAALSLTGGAPRLIGIGRAFEAIRGPHRVRRRPPRARLPARLPARALARQRHRLADAAVPRWARARQVKAEFQLGLHGPAIWWFEVDLRPRASGSIAPSGRPVLLPRISRLAGLQTAEIRATPPSRFLTGVRLDFTDLVLTRAFGEVPPSISMVVGFHKPKKISLFDVFQADLRSVAIVPGGTPGSPRSSWAARCSSRAPTCSISTSSCTI
ncbi:MAG: hypothetical protein IPI49_32130 [Myxococcales bacterium]|nr:hypothetical protein [Myxococcales bacterium]